MPYVIGESLFMQPLEFQLANWLNSLSIPCANKWLSNSIKSHADYPALTSATDTLDYIGIEYDAIMVDKSNLTQLTYPLLAHTNTNDGSLVLVRNSKNFTKTLLEQWSGVAFIAKPQQKPKNSTYNKVVREERQYIYKVKLLLFTLVIFILLPFIFHYNLYGIYAVLHGVLSIFGLYISSLIQQQELGIANAITNTLCKSQDDCHKVINSKAATLIWGIKWSDVGIIYFSTVILLQSVFAYTYNLESYLTSFSILSWMAIPFTLFSIFYQKSIAKKWCTLCLLTLIVLWLQAVLCIKNSTSFKWNALLTPLLAICFCLLIISAIWILLIKPIIIKLNKQGSQINSLNRFKYNATFFIENLTSSKRIDIPVKASDLQLANSSAPIQLVVACNPFCSPCVDAHFLLENILSYSSKQIGLTIHFMANHNTINSIRSGALNAIYKSISIYNALINKNAIHNILHNWFIANNIEKFEFLNRNDSQLSKLTQMNNVEIIKKSDTSSWDKEIEYTPTLLINGYKLPSEYTIKDFIKILPSIINDEMLLNKIIT